MNKHDNDHLRQSYIDAVNDVTETLDFDRLDKSCNSEERVYAKETLKKLHDLFVETYGTDRVDSNASLLEVPAIMRGRATGHIALGLITLDAESSGEHYGTFFLAPLGVIDHGGETLSAQEKAYLKKHLLPYDYWYTTTLGCDYHVDFERVPRDVAELLSVCRPDPLETTYNKKIRGGLSGV